MPALGSEYSNKQDTSSLCSHEIFNIVGKQEEEKMETE